MPKGKNKEKIRRKKEKNETSENSYSPVESLENCSNMSICSETYCLDPSKVTEEEMELISQDKFDETLKQLIDLAYQKSSAGRISSLQSINKAFISHFMPMFVIDKKETITNIIEHSLKKGKDKEQIAAIELTILLCIQLGDVSEIESLCSTICPMLRTLLLDTSVDTVVRAKCASILGLCCFLNDDDMTNLQSVMQIMETIFCNSHVNELTKKSPLLYSSALTSWSLILTLLPVQMATEMSKHHLSSLMSLLDSSDVDVRVAAGETIALLQELSQEPIGGQALHQKLKELATDSHKYRARKDRKQQRSSFRDIVRTVTERKSPHFSINLGSEVLELNSWCRKWHYNCFCYVLGSGMNLHLNANELLRDIFDLGESVPEKNISHKPNKLERHLYNVATCKARTVNRSKFRDKKIEFF